MSEANAHDGPLVELVARLHSGTTTRERVVRLRYRRKRPSAGQADGAAGGGCSAPVESRPDSLGGEGSGNDAAADGGNVNNNESEVGGE